MARLGSHRRGSVRLGSSMGAMVLLREPRLSQAPKLLRGLFALVLGLSLLLVVTGECPGSRVCWGSGVARVRDGADQGCGRSSARGAGEPGC